jgi:type I site-specific restriction endonuclease
VSEKETEEVIEFAKLQFTRKEISIITGVDVLDYDFEDAVMKGYLLSESIVRTRVFELAQSGSAPAVIEAIKIIEKRKAKG